MITTTKNWFTGLTPKLKQLTIVFAFIVALSSVWGVLKAFGVDALDFTIGCSSYSSQTEKNKASIDTLGWKIKILQRATGVQDSVNRFQDALNDKTDNRIQKLEDKQ